MLIFKTTAPEKTFEFGRQLAEFITSGFVLCLQGDLGAGKTLFVQGLADGLNTTDAVTSPTFTILNVYQAVLPIYHFDLYRLEQPEELYDVGFYEYTEAEGVAIIEWPDKFSEQLPSEHLWIKITPGDLINERIIYVTAQGARYQQVCEELKNIANSSFRYGHPCV